MKKMLTSIVLRGHKVPSLFFRATIPYSKLSSPFQTSVCKLVLVWRKEEISGPGAREAYRSLEHLVVLINLLAER
jgi:hypothetical protein